jgi:uncharacterized membrane protein YphA (DoxX/SURF4 family)
MSISSTLERLHSQARQNGWLWFFSIFCRLALAAGFIPSGMVKILGERFASGVSANHPMGHYLEALHTTGYYYTFIGVVQVIAALLLLIPRTAALGAFLYFPIILNICILTFAVRFDGSLFTAPLMVLANLFLLGWHYDKWKYILPFNRPAISDELTEQKPFSYKFPLKFFAGVFAAVVLFMFVIPKLYGVLPRNSLAKCQTQFKGKNRTKAGGDFCVCVHTNGNPLDRCLDEYNTAPDDTVQTP